MIHRRQLLGSALLCALPLTGCGFHLRGRFEAPFETLYLSMRENTPFSTLLASQIRAGSNVKIVQSPDQAQAVLRLLSSSRYREVNSINDAGRAREYQLTLSMAFRLTSAKGYDYIESVRFTAARDMSYTDTAFLSRTKEEEFLYSDMEKDIVNQLINVLATVQPHDGTGER